MDNRLTEKLDFSFTFSDYLAVDKIVKDFLKDRLDTFKAMFVEINEEVAEDFTGSCQSYIEKFVAFDSKDRHKTINKINHFINRSYEIFTMPEICPLIDRLKFLMEIPLDEIDDPEEYISNYEMDTIEEIQDIWDKLRNLLKSTPRIMLKNLEVKQIHGVNIYIEPGSDQWIINLVLECLDVMVEHFPYQVPRLDSMFIVDSKFINFSAGCEQEGGVAAFYIDDAIYYSSRVKEEDKEFTAFSIFHEVGHFLFEQISEEFQLFWSDQYSEWYEKGVKLSRVTKEHNEVEELFADAFQYIYGPIKGIVDNYVQCPSRVILHTVQEILNQEFVNS